MRRPSSCLLVCRLGVLRLNNSYTLYHIYHSRFSLFPPLLCFVTIYEHLQLVLGCSTRKATGPCSNKRCSTPHVFRSPVDAAQHSFVHRGCGGQVREIQLTELLFTAGKYCTSRRLPNKAADIVANLWQCQEASHGRHLVA